jgi:hypothetical protein
MKSILAFTITAMLGLSACTTGMSRMMSYPQTLSSDARVTVGHKGYKIWFHRTERTIIVQRAAMAGIGQAAASGLTLGAVKFTEPEPYWRQAALAMLGPLGCKVEQIYALDSHITWEASYSCPEGVDPRKIADQQRSTWLKGITVPDPYAPGN